MYCELLKGLYTRILSCYLSEDSTSSFILNTISERPQELIYTNFVTVFKYLLKHLVNIVRDYGA